MPILRPIQHNPFIIDALHPRPAHIPHVANLMQRARNWQLGNIIVHRHRRYTRERHRSLSRPALRGFAVGSYGRDTLRSRVGDGDGGAGRSKITAPRQGINVLLGYIRQLASARVINSFRHITVTSSYHFIVHVFFSSRMHVSCRRCMKRNKSSHCAATFGQCRISLYALLSSCRADGGGCWFVIV